MDRRTGADAKITRPVLTKYHPRERVYGMLDRYAEYPVVCVTGPAGSGKTTLVNSYLKERGIRCLWYRADEGDHDPATFFYYLRDGARVYAPRSLDDLPLLAPEYHSGLMAFTRRWFETLFAMMAVRSALVIDNYQEVPEGSVFHTVIREGLSKVPAGVQVFLVSRKDPPPELVRLKANMLLASIGWKDLRLKPEETAGIVELLSPVEVPKKRIRDLHGLADGWMAGVVLMTRKGATQEAEPGKTLEQVPEDLFTYFAGEVFDRLEPARQDFLVRTAFLPAMSVGMAMELTGRGDSGKILAELSRNNYFTERRFHKDMVYSYHPLFRQFLLGRAKERYTGEEHRAVVMEAASLLERNGQAEEALVLMHEAVDWEAMSRIIMVKARSMLKQGRHRTLERWISRLPADLVESSPWLQFCRGASLSFFDPVSSMKHIEDAYKGFKEANNKTGLFLSWAGITNSITFGGKSSISVETLLEDFNDRLQEFIASQSDGMKSQAATAMFATLVLHDPARVKEEGWDEVALDLAMRARDVNMIIMTLMFRIYFSLYQGRLQDAAEDLRLFNKFDQNAPMQEMRRIALLLANAQYRSYAGLHEECLSYAEKALELSETSGVHLWDVPLLRIAAVSCQNEGEYDRAWGYLHRLEKLEHEQGPREQSLAFAVRSRQAMAHGRIKEALSLCERGLQQADESGMPLHKGYLMIHKAWVCTVMGDEATAQEIMPPIGALAAKTDCRFISVNQFFINALIAFNHGEDERGLWFLSQGLCECREHGCYAVLMDHPPSVAHLLARALEAGIEVEYVREIIRRRKLYPPREVTALEHWPWPVKIYTLGRFEIVKDGVPLTFTKKAQKKPLEMLKAIIALGCTEVSEGRVADLLWPSADGNLALQNCATTVHRLRKLMGDRDVVQRKGGTLTLDTRQCWVDSRAFASLLGRAEELRSRTRNGREKERAEEISARAFGLYRGRFLPGETWCAEAMSLGDDLHERYFQGIYAAGRGLLKRGEWDRARRILEHGLTIDAAAEGCYYGLMMCLNGMGSRAEALAVYDRCKRTLGAMLGEGPSAETEALARKLRSGGRQ